MVHTTRVLIVFRQNDAVAAQLVDGADMLAVAAYDIHMLAHLLDRASLLAATRAPAAEFIVEALAMLLLIFRIVAVQLVYALLTPSIIVGVMMFAIIMVGAKGADPIAMIFAAIAAAFAGVGRVAAVGQIAVAARDSPLS